MGSRGKAPVGFLGDELFCELALSGWTFVKGFLFPTSKNLIGFMKILQVTRVVAGGLNPRTFWPVTPLDFTSCYCQPTDVVDDKALAQWSAPIPGYHLALIAPKHVCEYLTDVFVQVRPIAVQSHFSSVKGKKRKGRVFYIAPFTT